MKLTDGADPAALMSAIVQAARVRRVELKRVSVEDIFIDLVEKSGGGGEELDAVRTALAADRAKAGVVHA